MIDVIEIDNVTILNYILFTTNKKYNDDFAMFILHSLLKIFKEDFAPSRKADERSTWFIYGIITIITPFTFSKTSNLLRNGGEINSQF